MTLTIRWRTLFLNFLIIFDNSLLWELADSSQNNYCGIKAFACVNLKHSIKLKILFSSAMTEFPHWAVSAGLPARQGLKIQSAIILFYKYFIELIVETRVKKRSKNISHPARLASAQLVAELTLDIVSSGPRYGNHCARRLPATTLAPVWPTKCQNKKI